MSRGDGRREMENVWSKSKKGLERMKESVLEKALESRRDYTLNGQHLLIMILGR